MRYLLIGLALLATVSSASAAPIAPAPPSFAPDRQAIDPATPVAITTPAVTAPEKSASLLTNPWVVGGAVAGFVTLNAVTGGALMAPLIGTAASNVLGGVWLGQATLSMAANQILCRTMTILAGAAAGAGLGYWLSSDE